MSIEKAEAKLYLQPLRKWMIPRSITYPFGIDIFCFGKKFLIYNLVSRNLKIKYRRSIFGVFWTLLTPLAIALVYYFVFKVILKIQIPYYAIFILSGILPWTFFAQTISEGMESIVGNEGLITKVPVPLQIFPYVGAVTNLITLLLSLPILIGAAIFSNVDLGPSLVLLPYYFGLLFLLAYGFSIILSIAFVYFRDLRHIIGILLQLWMYGTPILYQESMIPENYHFILYFNPLGHIFISLHQILVSGLWPAKATILISTLWAMGVMLIATVFQKKFSRLLVEQI